MQTASDQAPADKDLHSPDSERTVTPVPEGARRCLVLGDVRPKEELIRFVVGPDNSVVPDLAQNLPGRGMWVSATRAAIDTAVAKNLFTRAAKTKVTAAADLADTVAALLYKRCLNYLGLAKSAGLTVLGQMQVEAAVKGEKLSLLFIAPDAGRDSEKLTSSRHQSNLMVSRRFSRADLGHTMGHEKLVFVGVTPHTLTKNLRISMKMLDAISPLTESTPTNSNT